MIFMQMRKRLLQRIKKINHEDNEEHEEKI
jgi:hypothetical protein